MFRDNRLATIVGSTTAGQDGNINPFTLPGGYTFNYTGMRVFNLDGSRFIGVGIPPDVAVEPTIAGIRSGKDEVLDKAIAIAEGK
jgi:C-terminal processing protease CtpA/Prc